MKYSICVIREVRDTIHLLQSLGEIGISDILILLLMFMCNGGQLYRRDDELYHRYNHYKGEEHVGYIEILGILYGSCRKWYISPTTLRERYDIPMVMLTSFDTSYIDLVMSRCEPISKDYMIYYRVMSLLSRLDSLYPLDKRGCSHVSSFSDISILTI